MGELGRPPKDQGQGNELNPDRVPTQRNFPGRLVAEQAERLMSTFGFKVILECFYSFVGDPAIKSTNKQPEVWGEKQEMSGQRYPSDENR